MPAIVRGSRAGMTDKKRDATSAIMLALFLPIFSAKNFRVIKKKVITAKANMTAGYSTAD